MWIAGDDEDDYSVGYIPTECEVEIERAVIKIALPDGEIFDLPKVRGLSSNGDNLVVGWAIVGSDWFPVARRFGEDVWHLDACRS